MFSEDLLHIDIREKAYFYNNLLGETCCDWILIYKCDFFCGWFLTLKNYLLSDLNFYAYLLAGISSRAGFIGSKKTLSNQKSDDNESDKDIWNNIDLTRQ